ncbi:MAG: histidinol-phosphatase HisJ family protein [Leptospirales bacterium]|nr:histidinol-phosphatase HisJ family protein [Leptospirales bacterium]
MVNYHNHTPFCGHATGELDEYIQKAIENHIIEFGFSDHAPISAHLRDGITMSPEQMPQYINSILSKKEEYKDRILIKLGLEIDFPIFDSFDKKYLTDNVIDYIIGSCHFIGEWGFDDPEEIYKFDEKVIDEVYLEYYSAVESVVDSGFCDIIGHFDLIKKFGHRPATSMNHVVRRIAKKMSKKNITAEVNTSGLKKPVKEIYPSDEILNIFFEENVPVTLGSDSHSPDDVCLGYSAAIEKLKKTGYKKVSGFTMRKRHDILL